MKKLKATLITFLGMVVLALAFTIYPPNQASARAGDKQYVVTNCITFLCNDCYAGTNTCTDHTCTQCEPPGQ